MRRGAMFGYCLNMVRHSPCVRVEKLDDSSSYKRADVLQKHAGKTFTAYSLLQHIPKLLCLGTPEVQSRGRQGGDL